MQALSRELIALEPQLTHLLDVVSLNSFTKHLSTQVFPAELIVGFDPEHRMHVLAVLNSVDKHAKTHLVPEESTNWP